MNVKSINGNIFYLLERFYQNLRSFYHRNYSLFDILFLLLYFLEQLLLIYYLFKFPKNISEVISVFALVVITTVSLQKIILDSKNKEIRDAYTDLWINHNILWKEYDKLKNIRKKGKKL